MAYDEKLAERVRVGPDAHAAALALKHARPMDFTGRPKKGFGFVDAAGTSARRLGRERLWAFLRERRRFGHR